MLPLENIKIKVVSKPEEYNQGYLHAFKKTVAEEGLMSFYKGMLMPLIGVGAQVSLQFGTVETLKKIIRSKFAEEDGSLHWKYSVLSGSLSGIPSAIVVVFLLILRPCWTTLVSAWLCVKNKDKVRLEQQYVFISSMVYVSSIWGSTAQCSDKVSWVFISEAMIS